MSELEKVLSRGEFAVTAESAPPKGCDFSAQLQAAQALRGHVHGVNVTDMQSACLKASSLGFCIALKQAGLEPILQLTGRDRNRMALQADVLSAAAFGIDTMLALTGDHPTVGDCKQAKPVYDLDSVGILRMLDKLEREGVDCGGNPLSSQPPHLFKGAVITPAYEPLELQLRKLKKKVDAGARFIQTQGVFDLECLQRLQDAMGRMGISAPVMAGIIPLKSAQMARYMNENVPGIQIPEDTLRQLSDAADEQKRTGEKGLCAKLGLRLASAQIAAIREQRLCQGVHIMAIGAERTVPVLLADAGLAVGV